MGKNTIHPGDKQTITLKVTDTNTTNAIAGAKVTGSIMNPSGSSKKKLDGVTDISGEASYSWTVGHNDATGRYKVDCKYQLLVMKMIQLQNRLKSLLYQ